MIILRFILILGLLGSAEIARAVGSASDENKARAMDQFIRGTVADQMEDYYRAVFHYQEALRYDSTSAFIHVALAQDYVLLGNTATAVELIDKALKAEADYVPALELKVVLMRGLENYESARDVLRKLTELFPDNSDYLRELMGIELGFEQFEEVERLYSRIVAIEGESDLLTRQLLAVYFSAKQYDRASALLKTLIASDSTDAGLAYALGTLYLQEGDTARGEQMVRVAARLEPAEPRYWMGLTVLAMDRGDVAQAVTIVDSALMYVDSSAALLSLKGTALNRLGRTLEAIDALNRSVQLDSTQFIALGTLALIYDGLDSLDRTEELYQKAIQLSDSAAVYMNNLAYTWAVRGVELDRAKELCDRALKADPKNGAYHDTMGWILYGQGQYGDAIDWLKKAIKLSPKSADILEHLGDAYLKNGSKSKAKKYYRQALDLDPDNETLRRKTAE